RHCIWLPPPSSPSSSPPPHVRNLLLAASLLWASFLASTSLLAIPVSRRSTNLPYALWGAAVNTSLLLGFALVASRHPSVRASPGFKAVNRNGLLVFVVANLLTGAANLAVDTIAAGPGVGTAATAAYIAVVDLFALALDWLDVTVKL
ncbi:hypothetical protein TeGR_g15117, partial [Tetraparma gracilis]